MAEVSIFGMAIMGIFSGAMSTIGGFFINKFFIKRLEQHVNNLIIKIKEGKNGK